MGLCRATAGVRPLRIALRATALAGPEAQFPAAARDRHIHPLHPLCGPVLDGRAFLSHQEVRHKLDGFHHARRADRLMAGLLLDATGETAADPAECAASGGGIGTWTRIIASLL